MMGRKQLASRDAAIELVRQLIETRNIPLFVSSFGRLAWHFGRFNEYNRELFQNFVIDELERTGALLVRAELCNECGHSVAPGSGRFVNRIPDLNPPEDRKEMGKPYPSGEFVCAECDSGSREVEE